MLRRIQYTGKRSMNEYKNMHFSLHHTRVVGASKWSGSVLYLVCVCGGGGGGSPLRLARPNT